MTELLNLDDTHPPVVQEGAVQEDFIALIKYLLLLFFSLKEKREEKLRYLAAGKKEKLLLDCMGSIK